MPFFDFKQYFFGINLVLELFCHVNDKLLDFLTSLNALDSFVAASIRSHFSNTCFAAFCIDLVDVKLLGFDFV
jgi:hypothetical protein